MALLTLDLGCGDYDIVRPLKDGAVSAEGLEINFITINRPPEVHWRMGMHQEFDAAEMSFGSFVAGKARGDYPFVGIPAFVYRKFRHSCAYVNVNAGIDKPEDLKGKRVGIPEWQMTATVWLRGFLQDDYGVSPSDIHWLTGGLESSERKEKVALKLPPEIKIENIPAGKNLSDMLVTGEIDALLTAQVPAPYVKARRPGAPVYSPIRARSRPIIFAALESFRSCMSWCCARNYSSAIPGSPRAFTKPCSTPNNIASMGFSATTPFIRSFPGRPIMPKRRAGSWAMTFGPTASRPIARLWKPFSATPPSKV